MGKYVTNSEMFTILIVEDEEINYLYLKALLENKEEINCDIVYARNGIEAVEICKKQEDIDFIFMDLRMPYMNGFEATKLIKEIRSDIPIVAQTAYSTKEDKEKALVAGCDDLISKPINEKTVYNKLNEYLINKK